MQVTLNIPDELAAELMAAGRNPSRTALEALTSYQRLLDLASDADEDECLRQALEDIAAGRTYPAEQVFAAMRSKHGIPGLASPVARCAVGTQPHIAPVPKRSTPKVVLPNPSHPFTV